MDNLFAELKRRNVIRVAGVYAVVGWLLAQVATTLEEALGLPGWFDGVIVALLLLGLPIALVFAWAFELTPEGVVRTENVPEGESITAETGRKLDYAVVAGLVLLGTIIVWQQLRDESTTTSREPSPAHIAAPALTDAATIAVLPFADLSPAGDQEYFSDGIAEEILNVLVGVDGLEVTSRTSSFQFKGEDIGIPEIAASLKVRHVVEGSVRKSGEAIRVTAQLIDADDDRHLWSDNYDRPLTTENIFQIQDEIANSIVNALRDTLGVGELKTVEVMPTTRNLNAYDLFLQARPLFLARRDLDVADELLTQALEQDPQYADAWEIRAALQTLNVEYGYSDTPIDEAEQRGLEFARRALAIDPHSATALAVIGKSDGEAARELRRTSDLAEAIETFSQALAIEARNASALNWRGLRYLHVGDLESAIGDFGECIEYEPYYVPCVENYFATLASAGRDKQALAAYVDALDTSTTKLQFAYFPLLSRMNEELAFKTATNDSNLLHGWRRHDELWRAYKEPEQDHTDLIESIRLHLDKRETAYMKYFRFIVAPLVLDWRVPETLVLWDASMKRYRQTDAFKHYIRESGVLDYWQKVGYPPQCRPSGDDDFECD